jgi:nitric oxide reductase large subunit
MILFSLVVIMKLYHHYHPHSHTQSVLPFIGQIFSQECYCSILRLLIWQQKLVLLLLLLLNDMASAHRLTCGHNCIIHNGLCPSFLCSFLVYGLFCGCSLATACRIALSLIQYFIWSLK